MEAIRLDGYRILVVDDNAPSRQLLQALLSALGAEVVELDNGLSSVELAATTTFDVILMDIQMPHLDGVEATKRIRANERAKGDGRSLIIGVTAHVLPEHRDKCLTAGMDSVVTKPIDPQALPATILQLLDS